MATPTQRTGHVRNSGGVTGLFHFVQHCQTVGALELPPAVALQRLADLACFSGRAVDELGIRAITLRWLSQTLAALPSRIPTELWHLSASLLEVRGSEAYSRAVTHIALVLQSMPADTPAIPPTVRDPRVRHVLTSLDKQYRKPNLAVADLATEFHISKWHLGRLLRRETGRTFKQLLNEVRLRKVLPLMDDRRLSIKEIAAATGFRSTSDLDHYPLN